MLPRLNLRETLGQRYLLFLQALEQSEFAGEIRSDFGTRVVHATDNSIYQILPQAVVFPTSSDDLIALFKLASQESYQHVLFAPKGGGTGTNGQSLSQGIIIDLSKYMNKILELNLEEAWVRVQPGVVLDQLNAYLKPHGFFFAPSLSPSSRATIGGMIGTDASGKGSRIYGKTSRHVLELNCIFIDGSSWLSKAIDLQSLESLKSRDDLVGSLYKEVDAIVSANQQLIEEQFPKMSRFLTGYNLAHVYSEDRQHFNLNPLICGSEGTLATVSEAKLRLTPIPKAKQLVVVKYNSFDDALNAAEQLVELNPAAIETIDETILGLAKEDTIYPEVAPCLSNVDAPETKTINLVEFVGDDPEALQQQVEALAKTIAKKPKEGSKAIGMHVAKDAQEAEALWNLRKKGVGLLGNFEGDRKPIAFIEDTAVPPQHLATYIQDLKQLLDSHGLQYAMFGHVDVGCLHVRPALNMMKVEDEALIREISDQVVALLQKYGGVLWAEHGKGFRSEYSPVFFGDALYTELRRIKELFDPQNRLNPGKVVTPLSSSDSIAPLESSLKGHFDRQIHPKLQKHYADALRCNGNGACWSVHPHEVMCPSSKVTRERRHSPKGRAQLIREWLRQLSLVQQSPYSQFTGKPGSLKSTWHYGWQYVKHTLGWFRRWRNTRQQRKQVYDYSQDVFDAMSGCLSCKACSSACPVHVDIPNMKSQFLEQYHTRYNRPLRDYFIAGTEWMASWQSQAPRFFNALIRFPLVRWSVRHGLKMVDIPQLSNDPLKEGLKQRNALDFELGRFAVMSDIEKDRAVILMQDAFTSFYEASLVLDIYDLLRMLGYVVYVAPFRPNGKPLHVKGFLQTFRLLAQKNVDYLKPFGALNIPIVGVDPSIALTYRDEYPKALKNDELGFEVHLLQEWLMLEITRVRQLTKGHQLVGRQRYALLGHCMEKSASVVSQQQWQHIFEAFGLELDIIPVGCCGMAGTYGHEKEHLPESKGIYLMSWAKQINEQKEAQRTILSTGYSCRSQVKRFEGWTPLHPAQALLQELRSLRHRH